MQNTPSPELRHLLKIARAAWERYDHIPLTMGVRLQELGVMVNRLEAKWSR